MKTRFFLTALLSFLLTAGAAYALDLHGARASGQVGEKADGYVAALQSSPDVDALVADVNAKRRTEYQKISAQNGQTVDVVGRVAAEAIIGKLPAGASYQDASGNWKKK